MSDVTTTIPKSVLGRNRKRYQIMEDLPNISREDIDRSKRLDLDVYNVQNKTNFTLVEYQGMLDALNKESITGKRDLDKETRELLITQTQGLCSLLNVGIKSHNKGVALSSYQKVLLFDELAESANALSENMKTAFAPVGALTLMWNPTSQNPSSDDGLAVYVGGWIDGSKTPRYQNAPRKCPISKRSGYRDDSFLVAFAEIPEDRKKEGKKKSVEVV